MMARAAMTVAFVLGGGALLLFAVFVIVGPFHQVQLGMTETGVLLWDAALSVLFFAQHSGMIRASFRARLTPLISADYQPAFFSIASGIALLALVLLWQGAPRELLVLRGVAHVAARMLSLAAALILAWSVRAQKTFDPFGLAPLRARLRGGPPRATSFATSGPYRWVRHPVYLGALLFIWSSPDVSLDRLLFSLLWTFWIWLGAWWEEKDLVDEYGNAYREYQRKVPMLIPWRAPREG
jgi:protein-S-isoprenylcysteine O-methyltransferase Ste14